MSFTKRKLTCMAIMHGLAWTRMDLHGLAWTYVVLHAAALHIEPLVKKALKGDRTTWQHPEEIRIL
jgi:hypothetical protein